MAISHCNLNFQEDPSHADDFKQSYLWEIENPNAPLLALEPPSSCLCLEYNQKDPTSLVAGLFSGQVAAWDTRYGASPVAQSDREVGHRDPVNSVLWINSKSGSEFLSGSSDGQVIWWDIRKLQPIERLLMDPIRTDDQVLERSFGVSVLEYEPTIPTRFMCGTEQGMLFSCNRKGKSPIEKINIRVRRGLVAELSWAGDFKLFLADQLPFGPDTHGGQEFCVRQELPDGGRLDGQGVVGGLQGKCDYMDQKSFVIVDCG